MAVTVHMSMDARQCLRAQKGHRPEGLPFASERVGGFSRPDGEEKGGLPVRKGAENADLQSGVSWGLVSHRVASDEGDDA